MTARSRIILFTLAGLGVFASVLIWTMNRAGRDKPITPNSAPSISTSGDHLQSTTDAKVLFETMLACSKKMAAATNSADKRNRLKDLSDRLSSASTNTACKAVCDLLDSRLDATTGGEFKIGSKGFLKETPTLRTYLLDYLGRTDAGAAAAYAKVILSNSDSPDEWALALRNLAMGDPSPEARNLLEAKTRDLLRNENWQQNPSAGYLEAFDAAVYLSGTNLSLELSNLVRRQDNQAVAHAAYLSLDRLVIADPVQLLTIFEAQRELMSGREQTRADFFARADVRDLQQRQLLEKYLLDPRTGSTEIRQFAGVYPNANFMISANLLTTTSLPAQGDRAACDAESLKVLNDWLTDSRFERLRPQLQQIKSRLEDFTEQSPLR